MPRKCPCPAVPHRLSSTRVPQSAAAWTKADPLPIIGMAAVPTSRPWKRWKMAVLPISTALTRGGRRESRWPCAAAGARPRPVLATGDCI
jgi:hypothetical protein